MIAFVRHQIHQTKNMKSSISLSFSVAFDKNDMTGDMDKDSLEARISGLSFYVDFDNYTEYSIEGGYLKAEPNNEYDPNAIAIFHDSGKRIGYISRECTLEVREFTDGENAPCLIYIAPFIDNEGEKGLKGVVRIFRYYDGQADYVNSIMEHFIDVYALKLKDELEEFEEKINEKYEALLTDSPDDEGHITFKGVPLNGSIEKVRAKIINAGFENGGEALTGSFAGLKVKAYVGGSEELNQVYSVILVTDQECSWESLKSKYLKVRELYIKKYGEPTTDLRKFCDPYYEGCGDELEATENQKCLYSSKFAVPGGEVSILIINRSVMFNFEDAVNKKMIGEYEEYEDADEFDEDYDAYDDI